MKKIPPEQDLKKLHFLGCIFCQIQAFTFDGSHRNVSFSKMHILPYACIGLFGNLRNQEPDTNTHTLGRWLPENQMFSFREYLT